MQGREATLYLFLKEYLSSLLVIQATLNITEYQIMLAQIKEKIKRLEDILYIRYFSALSILFSQFSFFRISSC